MSKRYCGMCDEWVKGRECPKCGADTDAPAKESPRAVDLMEALRRALPTCRCGCSDELCLEYRLRDGKACCADCDHAKSDGDRHVVA